MIASRPIFAHCASSVGERDHFPLFASGMRDHPFRGPAVRHQVVGTAPVPDAEVDQQDHGDARRNPLPQAREVEVRDLRREPPPPGGAGQVGDERSLQSLRPGLPDDFRRVDIPARGTARTIAREEGPQVSSSCGRNGTPAMTEGGGAGASGDRTAPASFPAPAPAAHPPCVKRRPPVSRTATARRQAIFRRGNADGGALIASP